MKIFAVLLLLFSIISCTNKNEINRQYWMYEKQVNQTSNAAGFSIEKKSDLELLTLDKSAPDMQVAVISVYKIAKKGDDQLNKAISKIENLKREILIDNGIYAPDRKSEFDFLYSDIKHFYKNPTISLSDYQGELDEISKLLLKWRTDWFANANSFYRTRDYYASRKLPQFYDPQLNSFSNEKRVNKMLEKATRDCSLDDQEGFKWFYIRSSAKNPFLDNDVNYIFESKQSLIETLTILTQIEYQLFIANGEITNLIGIRIGCCGSYQIDKIMPIANGNEMIQKGDSLSLEVFYAFYNSYAKPIVKITNLPEDSYRIRPEDGKVILKLKPKKSMTIKGTITISNKSGIAKTNVWEKTIQVVEK